MKKVLHKFLFTFFFLFSLLNTPNIVKANDEYNDKSKYISIEEKAHYLDDSKNIIFKSNMVYRNSDALGIKGEFINANGKIKRVDVKVLYYDDAYNEIARYTTYIEDNNDYIKDRGEPMFYDFILNSSDLTGNNTLDDIEYYQFEISYNCPRYNYSIENYDIDIVVSKDNTLNITEKLNVNFHLPKHGIVRKIPVRNVIERSDGTSSILYAFIEDVKVNDKFNSSLFKDYNNVYIGDSNKLITGLKDYEIKYTYKLGNDLKRNGDEFYFNLIGNDWDTVINNVTFKITMPEDFNKEDLNFYPRGLLVDNIDEYKRNDPVYQVDKNVITGKLEKPLDAHEALTVKLDLKEGYFEKNKYVYNNLFISIIVICILFVAFAYLLWHTYGRDNLVIETVEFYPPDNLDSLEMGYCYKGYLSTRDITSLIIYLANLGYLKIEETKEKVLLVDVETVKFIKIKDYDGNNELIKEFFDKLFDYGELNEQNQIVVNTKDLNQSFSLTTSSILRKTKKRTYRNKIFENNMPLKRIMLYIMVNIIIILINVVPIYLYSGLSNAINITIQVYLLFYFTDRLLFSKVFIENKKISKVIMQKIGFLFLVYFFGIIPFKKYVLEYILINRIHTITYVVGFISSVLLYLFINIISKRNKYGTVILGKIKGFKNFLETVEKDRLETLVKENPSYFYDILPYTYVLGVSSIWISKFESFVLESPSWLTGNVMFTNDTINDLMNNTIASTERSMTPRSSGGTGGGIAGGGAGGGGGSSW